MANPHQKKMVRTAAIWSKVVCEKRTKVEKNEACQVSLKMEKTKNTNQTA